MAACVEVRREIRAGGGGGSGKKKRREEVKGKTRESRLIQTFLDEIEKSKKPLLRWLEQAGGVVFFYGRRLLKVKDDISCARKSYAKVISLVENYVPME